MPIFLLVDISPDLARALVAYSSDGLVVVDADGTVRFASPAAERMLGYPPRDTFGRNVFDLVHPDDQVSALEGFESTKSSADSRPLPALVRLRRADGSWLQTEIIGTNYLDDEDVRGLLINVRDVERSMRTESARTGRGQLPGFGAEAAISHPHLNLRARDRRNAG